MHFFGISLPMSMCKSKKKTREDVDEPKQSRSRSQSSSKSTHASRRNSEPSGSQGFSFDALASNNILSSENYTAGSSYNFDDSWKSSSLASQASLSSLREAIPTDNAHIYEVSEICSATNNFLSKPYSSSSSSSSWKCGIRRNEVIVCQRKFRRPIDAEEVRARLSLICKSHHKNLIRLRGASISGNYIYLVYDYVQGASLADCLRSPKNPNFTVLSNWMSRIQIASDLAHGLDYIHHSTGLNSSFVHNHIKSSSIIVTEASLNAKICHFGTAELCGEIVKAEEGESSTGQQAEYNRSGSRLLKLEGTRGYMSPEFQSSGIATEKSDVYAFGVVILELISGDEPLKYIIDEETGGYTRISIIETAREAVVGGGGVRKWVDRRLKDSYPVDVAEKLVRMGLDCVEEDPEKRPDMGWVVVRISKMYLESQSWRDRMGPGPNDFSQFSVSFAPR